MQNLITRIRDSVIGGRHVIETPFGNKPLIYADYTASGRSLGMIEDYIRAEVLPFYANTHSESSFCGARMTYLRDRGRHVIKEAVRGREHDRVIFCGSGATAGIAKWIELLELKQRTTANVRERPLVLIGEYEHHSNDLPWRELEVELQVIGLDDHGMLDQAQIEAILSSSATGRQVIGSFSAASNVTGIKSDIERITRLLNRYGALSCWDYAAAAPYVQIDMSCGGGIDAVCFSPHKFIGGPGTPGVLVVNSTAITRQKPTMPGGGTVQFVSGNRHVYSDDLVRREEAGTPDIVGSIRAGLAVELQQNVGVTNIEQLEHALTKRALDRLGGHSNIHVLGNLDADRLSIVSFQIGHGDVALHYSLVVAMLNDLFGIQARGGCSCAGRYAHNLLDIDEAESRKIEADIEEGSVFSKPGWVRVNFNYFIEEAAFEYILKAIELIASHGEKLKQQYNYDESSGVFVYQGKTVSSGNNISRCFLDGALPLKPIREDDVSSEENDVNQYLEQSLARAASILC